MATERPDIETLITEHAQELEKPVEARHVTRLERLITAFHKIQETPSDAGDASYFYLSSYHGNSSSNVFKTQRTDVPSQYKNDVFCPHGQPEFPAWHRAYLYTFEQSLKAHDSTVMLPFWNESSAQSQKSGYPSLFTEKTFTKTDGTSVKNPLESFAITQKIDTPYSLSLRNNQQTFKSSVALVRYLSGGFVSELKSAFKESTYERFASSIEGPHGSVHVFVGGWMGGIDSSAFDPIFWFHHCFIDNMYWQWQVLNKQTTSITFTRKHSQLVPFVNSSTGRYYTIENIANIENFGYTYPPFDLKVIGQDSRANRNARFRSLGRAKVDKTEGSQKTLLISAIRFADFGGAFLVEVTARVPSGEIPLGEQSVFRFPTGCNNCNVNPYTEVTFRLKDIPQAEEDRIQFKVRIVMRDHNVLEFVEDLEAGLRTVHRIMGTSLQLEY